MRRALATTIIALFGAVGAMRAEADVDLAHLRPTSVATCDSLVVRYPRNLDAYSCYMLVASRHSQWSAAIRSLESILDASPEDAPAQLYLGSIESLRQRPRAEELLRAAARGFDTLGETRGKILALLELSSFMERTGRRTEARELADQARGEASRSSESELEVGAMLRCAQIDLASGDLVAARSLYEQAREQSAPVEPGLLHARLASGLASISWAEGRLEESLALYTESADLYLRYDDPFEEARARYNAALVAGRLVPSGIVETSAVVELAQRTVEVAVAAGNPRAEASARMLLAQDPNSDLETRIRETTRALDLLRQAEAPGRACFSLRTLAGLILQRDGKDGLDRALEILDEALECAASVGSLEDQVRAWIVRAGLFSSGRPKAECVRDLQHAVDAIETMRDWHPDQLARARFLWDWAFVYYRLAGRLLEPVDVPPDPGDAELAFRTIEKLRARILLDTLDRARATEVVMASGKQTESAREERGQVLTRIAVVQRDLMTLGLEQSEVEALLAELRRLEAREVELRVSMARADPSIAMLRMPGIPSIAQLQELLEADEAILSFQLSTRELNEVKWYWNGGSWVFVITRDDWFVAPLPDRDVLEKRIEIYLGLLSRRDALERDAGVRLFEDLLSPVVEALDPGIRKWVVVPDGALHRLPFAALRPRVDAEPLASRVELSEVPSATLWHHWKTTPVASRPPTVLALADPELTIGESKSDPPGEAERSTVPGITDRRLDALPYSRTEARTMVRRLGSGSVLRTGRDASEKYLKTVELGRFGIVHLATHAVVDPREPQRSAVLLSPGAPDEDGQLQLREVVELDLDDALVILSGCSSALGEITESEGVVGMARAFFQAGARTVVGSLWPMRDDEATELVTQIAGELKRGASVGQAVALTRQAAIARGLPPAAWSGLVVLGDGDHVPAPGGVARSVPVLWLASVALLLGFGLLVVQQYVSRRRAL